MDAQLTILDEIKARLGNLSIANGYRFDIEPTSIERARLEPFKNGDLPAINYWPTVDSFQAKAGGMETRGFDVTVEIFDTTRDEPFTDLAVKRGNDVVTALFRATTAPATTDPISYGLGGLVTQLDINSLTPMISEGQKPWFGALLSISIKYNITTGDFSTIQNY